MLNLWQLIKKFIFVSLTLHAIANSHAFDELPYGHMYDSYDVFKMVLLCIPHIMSITHLAISIFDKMTYNTQDTGMPVHLFVGPITMKSLSEYIWSIDIITHAQTLSSKDYTVNTSTNFSPSQIMVAFLWVCGLLEPKVYILIFSKTHKKNVKKIYKNFHFMNE